jgi:hypothetical protein
MTEAVEPEQAGERPDADERADTAAAAASARPAFFPLRVALAVLFGLFYAYDAWEAVGNLVGLSQYASALDTSITPVGWVVLIAAILLPVGLFAAAFVLGRRRSLLMQAGFYLAGLAVSALLYLDIVLLLGPGALFA